MITFSKLGNFGRLGNQLFQISTAIGLAKRNGDVPKFNKWEYSKYFKNPIEQDLCIESITNSYNENGFHYTNIPYSPNLDVIGYFQSEKYFLDCKETILYHLDFIDSLDDEIVNKDLNSCSIHIRRGDYVRLSEYHPFPGMEYYIKSIDFMRSIGVEVFYLFSDDIEWCKENFKSFNDIVYINGNIDIKDLFLMSKCKNNIIANSSFSWWGAWLNKNSNKKVIAPATWFGPKNSSASTKDLYCSSWLIF
jgi:hypothetical protein